MMSPETASDTIVEPYRGVVNVMFADAMLASTTAALLLRQPGREPVIFIPFRDIYFEFLHRSPTSRDTDDLGRATFWNVSAKGEAKDDIMWAYDAPHADLAAIIDHGAFDAEKVTIEVAPPDDPKEEEHAPAAGARG
jgi:uncharacterized protein (DUF427 family)